MKLLSRPDVFMFYGKLGLTCSTSELLCPNMEIRLRLIRARPSFYMISDKPNVSHGIVDSSLYTPHIVLKGDYHKNRTDTLAFAPVEKKLFRDFGKDIHHTCEAKPIHSRKDFQHCSRSSSRDCNEHKLRLHWFFY